MKRIPSRTRIIQRDSDLGRLIEEGVRMHRERETSTSLMAFHRYLVQNHGLTVSFSALRSFIMDVLDYRWR